MFSTGTVSIHGAYWRLQNKCGAVTNYLRVATAGFPSAKTAIESESHYFVEDFLSNPKYSHLFVDVVALKATGFETTVKEQLTHKALFNAEQLVKATVLVFDHSALDAMLLDFCTATDDLAPEEWDTLIERKKVSYSEISSSEKPAIRKRLVDEILGQLSRESILKKAERLHQICKPEAGGANPDGFTFCVEELEEFDTLRHNIVHKASFDLTPTDIWKQHEYVSNVASYFYEILARRFDIRLDAATLQTIIASVSG